MRSVRGRLSFIRPQSLHHLFAWQLTLPRHQQKLEHLFGFLPLPIGGVHQLIATINGKATQGVYLKWGTGVVKEESRRLLGQNDFA